MSDYLIAVDGLADLKDIDNLDERILRSARQAINRAAERGRAGAAKEMRQQVNFPVRYLSGQDGRLRVSRRAGGSKLEAAIAGRDRPTSLARFAKDRDPTRARKAGGVNVSVRPGKTKFMKGAFLMQLNGGNLGLAIRLKDGESIRNKRQVTKIGKGLYLLYGPSVDQVFRTVAEEQTAPEVAEFLENEFVRLLAL